MKLTGKCKANKILLERRKCNCIYFKDSLLDIKIKEKECKECIRKRKLK